MKKSRRNTRTANPAKKKRGASSANEPRPGGWARWVGREVEAFFGLPLWLKQLILSLAAGALLAAFTVWRWLAS